MRGEKIWVQASALVGNKLSFPPSSVISPPGPRPPAVLLMERRSYSGLPSHPSVMRANVLFSKRAEGDLGEAGVLQHCWVFTVCYAPTSSVDQLSNPGWW